MPAIIKQMWSALKEKPDIWFFYLFLISSTLSVRKVLFFYPMNNSFNEYTGVYIYLSDLLLISTFIFYILYNINYILSNIKVFLSNCHKKIKMFHTFLCGRQVKQLHKKITSNTNCSTWNNYKNAFNNVPRGTLFLFRRFYTLVINNYLVIFPLFIAFFSFLSILWTINKPIAIYRSIKLLEFILLYFYTFKIVPRGTIQNSLNSFTKKLTKMFHACLSGRQVEQSIQKKNTSTNCSTWNNYHLLSFFIILIGSFQALIGIIQFLKQSSIGLFWLKESIISPSISGVAKVILNGNTYVRAYGLFPHPNILGGFLVFSIALSLFYIKMFHVEHFSLESKNTKSFNVNCSTWNNLRKYFNTIATNKLLMLRFLLLIQITALLLSFSKSAIFGLLAGLFYISTLSKHDNVPRGTLLKQFKTSAKMFHVEHFKRKIILLSLILFALLLIIKPNLNSLFLKSLQERELYLNVSRGTLVSHPLLGIGAGQFVLNMQAKYTFDSWQYQPVHNVFLLIANEYGLIILIAFLLFLSTLLKKPNCSTWNNLTEKITDDCNQTFFFYLKGILLAFIFIMFFDHYMWDIQQGQIMLWTLFALIASQKKNIAAIGD